LLRRSHAMRAREFGAGPESCEVRRRVVGFFGLVLLGSLGGCSQLSPPALVQRKARLYDQELSAAYDATRIKKSLTLDVLPRLKQAPGEPLNQSDNVAGCLGRDKNGYRTWFTLVRFHEYELSVIRKYFFLVDERIGPRHKRGLRFDCQMLLSQEELEEIRKAKRPKQFALLRSAGENLRKDIAELHGGEAEAAGQLGTLEVSALLLRQILENVILELERSDISAAELGEPNGVQVNHINFGPGKVRLRASGNTVTIRMRFGALVPTFEALVETPAAPQAAEPAKEGGTSRPRFEQARG